MSIEEYIRNLSMQINNQYGREVLDENKILRLIEHFNSDSLEIMKPRIDRMMSQIIEPLETQDIVYNPEQIDTGLQTNNNGTYLSSLMTTALSLVNCNNIEEINEWINSVPNLYTEELYEVKDYTSEELETIKRNLFDKYQDSLTSLETTQIIGKDSSLYALHKKIKGLNLSQEEEKRLTDIGLTEGIPTLYSEIERICIDKYGQDKGKETYTKIVNYFTSDFENFNSSTYDQIVAFNEEIKSNIDKCNSSGGDYQLVIGSLNYANTVSKKGEDYDYNFGVSTMGQKLSDKLGCSYRIRSMINRLTAEEMKEKGLSKEDTIQVLRDSLRGSLQSFRDGITDDKPRTFELFNELIEIQKKDKDYKNVWEKHFGITLQEMIDQVVMPNTDIIQELKNKNVDFMYNETMLQESPEKREKVLETLTEIQEKVPGLITVFGDQDHTFCDDYKKENIGQLKETIEFLKEVSKTIKVECTERDLYFSARDLKRFKELGMSKEDVLKYKQSLENKHTEIYKDAPYTRECEWTTISNISGEFTRDRISPSEESYMGKYTKISDMKRKDNEKVSKELNDYTNWQSNGKELSQMMQKNNPKPVSKETPKVYTKNNNQQGSNTGTVGIFDLVAIIGIAVSVTVIITIINMLK